MPDLLLSEKVRKACHVLALDDERTTFHPVLWDERGQPETQFTKDERISQVWFTGVHANVGGGYPDDSLAQIPLYWIMQEAKVCGLRFKPANPEAIADPEMARHMAWLRETQKLDKQPGALRFLNWKLLLTEEQIFADSKEHLGLQLADITATTFRRALNNHLRPEGWEPFGQLLTHKRIAPFVLLGKPGTAKRYLDEYATTVWRTLTRQAKNMLIDE